MTDLPADIISETAVLGFILAAGPEEAQSLPLTAAHFYLPVNAAIFRSATALSGRVPFLLPAVADDIADALADAGGSAYLRHLIDRRAGHPGAAAAYAHFIIDAYERRRLVRLAFHLQAVAAEVAVGAADLFQSPPAAEQHAYLRARLASLLALVDGADR